MVLPFPQMSQRRSKVSCALVPPTHNILYHLFALVTVNQPHRPAGESEPSRDQHGGPLCLTNPLRHSLMFVVFVRLGLPKWSTAEPPTPRIPMPPLPGSASFVEFSNTKKRVSVLVKLLSLSPWNISSTKTGFWVWFSNAPQHLKLCWANNSI